MQIKLIIIWMVSHGIRFENETNGNSEMAYLGYSNSTLYSLQL